MLDVGTLISARSSQHSSKRLSGTELRSSLQNRNGNFLSQMNLLRRGLHPALERLKQPKAGIHFPSLPPYMAQKESRPQIMRMVRPFNMMSRSIVRISRYEPPSFTAWYWPEGNTETIARVTPFSLAKQRAFGNQIRQVPGGRRR
jgi:hypothetical protein